MDLFGLESRHPSCKDLLTLEVKWCKERKEMAAMFAASASFPSSCSCNEKKRLCSMVTASASPPSSSPSTSTSPLQKPTLLAPTSLPSSSSTRRRGWMMLLATLLSPITTSPSKALQPDFNEDEERLIHLFRETTASVVCIKDLQLVGGDNNEDDDGVGNAKVDGIGSGFIWDKMGHIVTNYHVISKFATDRTGRQRCKVFFLDSSGNTFSREGKLIGVDPADDLAVLKVDIEGNQLKPAVIGTSNDLRVGQSCFAIGNPYGFEHTLTSGVVSGLGREIPSTNGQSIRGAIQTDASINAGNSGGPLIDSHGHVIGVNTATFSRKGTGLSSGVNFAIPIDLLVRIVPYIIVYGTSKSNRF